MIEEIKKLKFTCDGCSNVVVEERTISFGNFISMYWGGISFRLDDRPYINIKLPDGWKKVRTPRDGYRMHCPCCLRKLGFEVLE